MSVLHSRGQTVAPSHVGDAVARSVSAVVGLVHYITADSEHQLPPEAVHDFGAFSQWWRRLCAWPPNVFALTSAILHESGIYRDAPLPDWSELDHLTNAGEWLKAIECVQVNKTCCTGTPELPARVRALGEVLWKVLPQGLEPDDTQRDPAVRRALIELHCLADEACYALGLPHAYVKKQVKNSTVPPDSKRRCLAAHLLEGGISRVCECGTLSCFDPLKVRVLPKKHTPQVGITLRSVSLHVGAVRGEVKVAWSCPSRRMQLPQDDHVVDSERRLNLLLVPWPYVIQPKSFKYHRRLTGPSHEFDFEVVERCEYGGEAESPESVTRRLLVEARERGMAIDGVVFPELSFGEKTFQAVHAAIVDLAPQAFLLGGVSVRPTKPDEAPRNEAWLKLDGEDIIKQEKHHKWCIDAAQIRQYHLGSALLAEEDRRYWERMRVGRRSIAFTHLRPGMTLCHLICEDLARVEPVAEIIRAVGPNLVLDGPQLEKRWPGRYASVFADDPGSSVLTFSSLGMVRRSRGRDDKESTVVGLWKDQRVGSRELALANGDHALVLSLVTNLVQEWTFDGRADGRNTGILTFAGVETLRLSAHKSA